MLGDNSLLISSGDLVSEEAARGRLETVKSYFDVLVGSVVVATTVS